MQRKQYEKENKCINVYFKLNIFIIYVFIYFK